MCSKRVHEVHQSGSVLTHFLGNELYVIYFTFSNVKTYIKTFKTPDPFKRGEFIQYRFSKYVENAGLSRNEWCERNVRLYVSRVLKPRMFDWLSRLGQMSADVIFNNQVTLRNVLPSVQNFATAMLGMSADDDNLELLFRQLPSLLINRSESKEISKRMVPFLLRHFTTFRAARRYAGVENIHSVQEIELLSLLSQAAQKCDLDPVKQYNGFHHILNDLIVSKMFTPDVLQSATQSALSVVIGDFLTHAINLSGENQSSTKNSIKILLMAWLDRFPKGFIQRDGTYLFDAMSFEILVEQSFAISSQNKRAGPDSSQEELLPLDSSRAMRAPDKHHNDFLPYDSIIEDERSHQLAPAALFHQRPAGSEQEGSHRSNPCDSEGNTNGPSCADNVFVNDTVSFAQNELDVDRTIHNQEPDSDNSGIVNAINWQNRIDNFTHASDNSRSILPPGLLSFRSSASVSAESRDADVTLEESVHGFFHSTPIPSIQEVAQVHKRENVIKQLGNGLAHLDVAHSNLRKARDKLFADYNQKCAQYDAAIAHVNELTASNTEERDRLAVAVEKHKKQVQDDRLGIIKLEKKFKDSKLKLQQVTKERDEAVAERTRLRATKADSGRQAGDMRIKLRESATKLKEMTEKAAAFEKRHDGQVAALTREQTARRKDSANSAKEKKNLELQLNEAMRRGGL